MDIPFWEESYKDDNISAFGIEPNTTVVEFEHLYNASGNILEIGCGEGKNALYLAKQGFQNIDAFDLSDNAIAKLNRAAQRNELALNAWVQDLRQFRFEKLYHLVISFGTLHFVEKADWKTLLFNTKANTVAGGLHIIQIFTNTLPASPDIAPFAIGLSDDRELEALYSDWNILQYKSYSFEDEHPGAPKHFHAANKIVAQRKHGQEHPHSRVRNDSPTYTPAQ